MMPALPTQPAFSTKPTAPTQSVSAHRRNGGDYLDLTEAVAVEIPVAMQYNARPHAVMMATPTDLEDFAYGFTVTERIVDSVDELTLAACVWTEHGVALEMLIPQRRLLKLQTRERNLTGRTGCGLCGTASLESAIRPVRTVSRQLPRVSQTVVCDGIQRLASMQPLNRATGAVHAAAMICDDDSFTVREDVGRHNAIDKVAGAVLRSNRRPHTLFVTSRASYEVVHKAAEIGCRVVAAISAPTSLAVRLAAEAGVTLVGWTRPPRLTIYTGALG
jgi:formate dehydrogenase accessory protein FdhD